ncbi:RluA family pseudouridine synthase [Jeongeupia naejangsanensis]|uniref:Dual-specificity RNA pseudouridine synthase RluA n=1 Tax=Jeongeupia naejangsanensis TaxID=613195 RepID=A0ABS2BMG6_9NEIS|nr:pseudouridine synthase [Jeongeupia naejangsanensis]MBM3116196.1 RNA pseudouridine synthase [Jeongeupia naejangsanensis]
MHTLAYFPPPDAGLNVIHADASLLVVDKPAGLLAVPGRGDDKADCLSARVQAVYPDALIVHRLDMATSGLVVFGRGIEAQRRLGHAFEHRLVTKRYIAVVAGVIADDAGEIDLPLAADWPNRPRQKVDFEAGKRALTRYSVIERGVDRCRVALEPVTGRTHQLRVHLQAIGHPILGDMLYAGDRAGLAPRLLLHAESLSLPHPDDGTLVCFEALAPF